MKFFSGKRYFLELGSALLAYALLLVGSITLLQNHDPGSPWREMLALSPLLGGFLAIWAILRALRRMDELQRRVQLEALVIAFTGTAILSFAYGFLEGLGYPRLSLFVVWPVMALLWILGAAWAARRYR